MNRSEVYSWRLAPDLKSELEREAKREGRSLGALLEKIAQEWLHAQRRLEYDAEEQKRLHEAVYKNIGGIEGESDWSITVRETVRRSIRKRRAR